MRKLDSSGAYEWHAWCFATPRMACELDVLVIDDDKAIRRTVRICLEAIGCRVTEVATAPAMRSALEQQTFDVALLDVRLGRDNGIELLPLLAAGSSIDVIVMTGFVSIGSAVEAMRRGAFDYLAKPFTPPQLRELVERVAARRGIDRKVEAERARREHALPEIHLHTESPRMLQALDAVGRVAPEDLSVLIFGERGTGKTSLARRLHALSARGAGPFVVVDAQRERDGSLLTARVAVASHGTLFIDGIEWLTPTLQEKLLALLTADVRLVAATTKELAREVHGGRFLGHLLERFVPLPMPALRERREDILPLARSALAFFARGTPVPKAELTLDSEAALSVYAWPGNIRELCAVMERAIVLRTGVRVGIEALPEAISSRQAAAPYLGGEFTIEDVEREHILRVLAHADSQEEASRILGIDPSTLWRKRRRYEGEE
jgi:two-component system, NtrC family, response regulator AlgB